MPEPLKESNYLPPVSFEDQTRVIAETLEALGNDEETRELRESLDDVRRQLMFEDRGWIKWWASAWGSQNPELGLTLEEIQDVSTEIRSQITGASLLKNAVELRSGFIWSKGFAIPGTEKPVGRGTTTALRRWYVKQSTQECLISATASYEMEKSAFADGNYLLLGDDSSKVLHRVPLWQVQEVYTDPQFIEEVWAYKIALPNKVVSNPEPEVRWVYTDRYPNARKQSIRTNNQSVGVKAGHTIFDARFNRQVGQPLGTPDALPAVAWARAYSEGMKGGLQMQKALAYLAFKITSKSSAGAANAGAKVAAGRGSGNTTTMVAGQDMNPLATAGKGYDFSSLRDVAGMVAAAVQVSVVSLLASPGAAGSSYGAAATLDKPQRDAMRQRQQTWADFFRRITFWVSGEYVAPVFPPIDDPDPYREMQRIAIAWGTGSVWADELRPLVLTQLGTEGLHDKAPAGILIPNNEFSEPRNDIDPGGSAYAGPDSNAKNSPNFASSPGQGQGNGTQGGQGSVNDQRTDVLANAMAALQLDELRELVERLERAKS